VKKLLAALALALAILVSVVLVRAALFRPSQVEPVADVEVEVDARAAAGRLARSLTFRTVSPPPPTPHDSAAFRALHDHFAETYPELHGALERETVSGLSLLYTWEGADPQLPPVVLMGHLDVVPVTPGTEDAWTHPPFGGTIAGGYVWGRGAMDDKASVVSILEAVERLVAAGYRPPRTVYLAFGHDEELGGERGAARIAEHLASGGTDEFALVLDEGGALTEGMVPGVDAPTALIGIAEKGYVSLALNAHGDQGHSSAPPPSTSVGILARAIARLQDEPFPMRIDGPTRAMFENLAPEMSFLPRAAFANLWLLEPAVTRVLASRPMGAAFVRTTTAPTILDAGVKDNVLPPVATGVVNFRILPGETVETVRERVVRVIDDDRVDVEIYDAARDPSPVSDTDSPAFRLLDRTLRQVVPGDELVIAPYLVFGGTDATHYADRSRSVYRFLPVRVEAGDLGRVHGTDERISVEGFGMAVGYFYQLLRNLDDL